MMRCSIPVILLCLSVGSASIAPATAGVPLEFFAHPSYAAGQPVSVYTLPDGSGHPLSSCFSLGGGRIDATIELTMMNGLGQILTQYPAEDIWLEAHGPNDLVLCAQGAIVDGPTDALGRTSFSGPFRGGGALAAIHGQTEFFLVSTAGDYCADWIYVPISVNSPDVDGNLVVNLSDVVLFAEDFYGAYDYRSDFHWDGMINLSDLVLLVQGFGAACP
jgi:hypothetical protein